MCVWLAFRHHFCIVVQLAPELCLLRTTFPEVLISRTEDPQLGLDAPRLYVFPTFRFSAAHIKLRSDSRCDQINTVPVRIDTRSTQVVQIDIFMLSYAWNGFVYCQAQLNRSVCE